MNTKAMILAAGLGTRLRPVTDTVPKALVVVQGRTLLETAILHLAQYGIREIIVNVHHFAAQVVDFLEKNGNFGLDIAISDESDQLLDTGGGLKKAAWFFGDGMPFLVRNADVISDLDLGAMLEHHIRSRAMATLAVRKRETERYFLFDGSRRLCGWVNTKTGEKTVCFDPPGEVELLAFSGIQVVDPGIFPLITEEGCFSLTRLYLRLAGHQVISGYMDEGTTWRDVGKSPADLSI
jgi:NDP-sugar pyrophosphorylase family protein